MVVDHASFVDHFTSQTLTRFNRILAYGVLVATLAVNILAWPIPDLGFQCDFETCEVAHVEPNSMAEGILQIGDRVVRVGRESARQFFLRPNRFSELNLDDQALDVMVERNGQSLTLQLPLVPPSGLLQISKFAFCLLAIMCWVTGYFLGVVQRHELPGTPLVATYWILMSGVIGIQHFAVFASQPLFTASTWFITSVLAPLAIYIHLRFPLRSSTSGSSIRKTGFCLLAGSIFINVCFVIWIIVWQKTLLEVDKLLWVTTSLSTIGALGGTAIILYRAYHHNTLPHTQRQIRLLTIVCASVMVSWLILYAVPFFLLGDFYLRVRWLVLLIGAIPLAYLVGGRAYYLYRAERLARRLFVHLITAAILIVLLALSTSQFNLHRISDTLWLATAFVLPYRLVQYTVLRLLPRSFRPEDQSALEAAIQGLPESLEPSELITAVVAGVRAQFGQPPLAFYLADAGTSNTLRLYLAERLPDLPDVLGPGTLIGTLVEVKSVVESHVLQRRLQDDILVAGERELLCHPSAMLWCPIRRAGSPSLLALLVLGRRGDIDSYTRSDRQGLQRLIAAAAPAFTHSAAYSSVEQQVRDRTAELEAANQQLRASAAQVEELATTQERNRLAREIHDGLGHYFTAINMQIAAGRAVLDRDRDCALMALEKAQQLTDEGLADVRRSVAALRESALGDRPLADAIATLIETYRVMDMSISLRTYGHPRPLAQPVRLALFRTAQEALTNVGKHAQAGHVEVQLDYRAPSAVRLSIEDDGLGTCDTCEGFGLIGVRERVQVLGGTLRIASRQAQGFRLEVEVPG